MNNFTLIANSGLQFLTTEIEINPDEPLMLSNQKRLEYTFVEDVNLITQTRFVDLAYYAADLDKYFLLSEMRENGMLQKNANGIEQLNEAGLGEFDANSESSFALLAMYEASNAYKMSLLNSYRILQKDRTQVPMFRLLLGKWLPMPMYELGYDGTTLSSPKGWCRVKIEDCGEGSETGSRKYRCVWAFDTNLTDNWASDMRPIFYEGEDNNKTYTLCNKADQILDFMSLSQEFHSFSTYIASLIGQDLQTNDSRKFIAYYIYFVNYLRLKGSAPTISLYNNKEKEIPVDMAVDIGNSRTCGVYFENGEFTRATTQGLRDMSRPWVHYRQEAYEMRVAFRRADFGSDIVIEDPSAKSLFQWCSFVRIGKEAQRLIYRSIEDEGLSQKNTNYSSPKRYIWDTKPFEGTWENEIVTDDENPQIKKVVAIPNLSNYFTSNGEYKAEGVNDISAIINNEAHYSRSSLMTFAFIEIFQQAICEINSFKYRKKWGNVDCRRYLRTVIITCPTAMSQVEQVRLREMASNAFDVIRKNNINIPECIFVPNVKALKNTDPYADVHERTWIYDEAFSNQLVYLYAEMHERYKGELGRLFEQKGHIRPDLQKEGYDKKSLTIGTVDIGGGTTDVMICTYKQGTSNNTTLTPVPLYWDSFYLAGDDISRQLVQNIVIEGRDNSSPILGNISSALKIRIKAMNDTELQNHPVLEKSPEYRAIIASIVNCIDEREKELKKEQFAMDLVHSFFGNDSSLMGFRDRRCRLYFNTQISLPIIQKWLELLQQHSPSKLYTFEDLFYEDLHPAKYLLDYFYQHFGFHFEELNWRYDPEEVAHIVKTTIEPLMKQLALVIYAHHCDIIVLSGRPSSLDCINEFFVKYLPTSPDRLIRLNDYHVGNWFPTSNGQGFFMDQKTTVAVGGMIGYLASMDGVGLPGGLRLNMAELIKKMSSTAHYIGEFDTTSNQIKSSCLTPTKATATINTATFPLFLGCKQFDAPFYQARPLFAIYNYSGKSPLTLNISRDYHENREDVRLEDATDINGNNINRNNIEIRQQSVVDDGQYWLDKGEFTLTIKH